MRIVILIIVYFTGFLEKSNEIMCVRHSAWYLVHSKHSINTAVAADQERIQGTYDPAMAQA